MSWTQNKLLFDTLEVECGPANQTVSVLDKCSSNGKDSSSKVKPVLTKKMYQKWDNKKRKELALAAKKSNYGKKLKLIALTQYDSQRW